MKNLILELSHNCNFNCTMCGYGGKKIDKDLFMSWDTFRTALKNYPAEEIRLNGRGESVIHPDFDEMLIYASRSTDSQLEVFTNGSFNKRIAKLFIKHNVKVYISMDSVSPSVLESIRSGVNFEKLMKAINSLNNIYPRPYIVFTLQNRNINEIEDIAYFAFAELMNIIYNVIHIQTERIEMKNMKSLILQFNKIQKLYQNGELDCQIPNQVHDIPIGKFKETNNENNCPAVDREITICYNGDVLPCNMFHPEILGNIHNRTNIKEFKNKGKSSFCKSCSSMT